MTPEVPFTGRHPSCGCDALQIGERFLPHLICSPGPPDVTRRVSRYTPYDIPLDRERNPNSWKLSNFSSNVQLVLELVSAVEQEVS